MNKVLNIPSAPQRGASSKTTVKLSADSDEVAQKCSVNSVVKKYRMPMIIQINNINTKQRKSIRIPPTAGHRLHLNYEVVINFNANKLNIHAFKMSRNVSMENKIRTI